MYDNSDSIFRAGMMNRVLAALVTCVVAGCAGCPGTGRHVPGPTHISRRSADDGAGPARRRTEPEPDALPLSSRPTRHPALGRIRGHGSFSIGSSTWGLLHDGKQLPAEGPHHRIMPEQASRGTAWGTEELVDAIQKAAADVAAKRPGAILGVGNLSRGGGGRLKWSVSHRSGRDADFGFYLQDASGLPMAQKTMTRIARDGTTVLEDGTVARFDPAANWAFVKSLLANRTVSIQWIFMADHLKNRMLTWAKSRKEPARLIALAEQAVAQPRGRIHDDHIHVRIYCPKDDLLEGCVDRGSNRPWYAPPGPAVARRKAELLKLARSKDVSVRRNALIVLGHFGDRDTAGTLGILEILADSLRDRDPGVRQEAADALAFLGLRGIERRVVESVLDPAVPDEVADRLMRALSVHLNRDSDAPVLRKLLTSERTVKVDNGVFEYSYVVADRAVEIMARFRPATAIRILEEAVGDAVRNKSDVDRLRRAVESLSGDGQAPGAARSGSRSRSGA